MKHGIRLFVGLGAAGIVATHAISQENTDKAIQAAVKARQSQMTLYAFNIGLLGSMAKGEVEYDAEAATAAATNLASLSKLDQSRLWPQGSDAETLGSDTTEALPAIWEEGSDIGDKAMALISAADDMQAAAGDGLDALRGAIGPVGKSCGGCHEDFRLDD
ncbi:c-type cytochrome [Roseovarius indicus]|uniref:c-type cytochrome n=1 Tax=Roseovarius indicus TaxID=540747 RepID=UPI0032ED9BD8